MSFIHSFVHSLSRHTLKLSTFMPNSELSQKTLFPSGFLGFEQ